MPSISYVVARSEPGHVIGCDNKLPWHLKTDLKNFKAVTSNHAVIMGRKTFESIGKPLPGRINIVMSGKAYDSSPEVYFADSRDSALYFADLLSALRGWNGVFVIGGSTVYEEFRPLFNKVYLTEVYADIEGDAHFDYDFTSKDWQLTAEQRYENSDVDDYPFAIKTLEKRAPRNRKRSLSSFLKPDENLKAWESEQLDKIHLPRSSADLLKAIQLKLPNIATP